MNPDGSIKIQGGVNRTKQVTTWQNIHIYIYELLIVKFKICYSQKLYVKLNA